MVVCLNVSFLASFFSFFHVYMKENNFKPFSKKKKKNLLIYLSIIKTELAISFLRKTFVLGRK